MTDLGFTTRAEIEQQQADRLPSLAVRIKLHPHPTRAVQEAIMADAIELSAADVLEMGKAFEDLSDQERNDIFQRNYAHCMDRAGRFFQTEELRN